MRRVVVGLAITFGTLAPSWLRADDQQIAQEIVEKLKAHQSQGELRGFNIDLQVDQGTVLLTGQVADERQQQLALEVARRAAGVKQVVNDLTVAQDASEPGPRRFALSEITRLKLMPERDADAERPQSRNLLSALRRGSRDEAPRKPATQIMQTSAHEPVDELEMSESDERIAQQIFQRLEKYKKNGQLQGFQLDLKVEDGSVWLEGYVSTPEQKRLTLEMARRIPGVTQVVDVIRVESTRGRNSKVIPVSSETASHTVPATLDPAGAVPLSPAPAVGVPVDGYMATPVPIAQHYPSGGVAPVRYDQPYMPGYAWPTYAAYPNYAAVTYPRQYSPAAWPYIGPFYPYPQVPLGWRKVTLEWDDGWWHLDFCEK